MYTENTSAMRILHIFFHHYIILTRIHMRQYHTIIRNRNMQKWQFYVNRTFSCVII